MKARTRKLLIGTALAAAVGATGMAVADMGGYNGACPQGAQMQQGMMGQGPGTMMNGMMGRMMGGMQGQGPGAMMGHMQGHMMNGMQGQGPGAMMGGMRGGMGYALELTDEQRTEMGKIRDEFLPQMGALRGRMQANHEQLQALLQDGTADQAAIDKLADQHGDLMAEMIKMRTANMARMQGLLTGEQREQMREHRGGMGIGSGMGPGMMGTPPAGG
jgi:Spy/CpxP family protein refolding chaperone